MPGNWKRVSNPSNSKPGAKDQNAPPISDTHRNERGKQPNNDEKLPDPVSCRENFIVEEAKRKLVDLIVSEQTMIQINTLLAKIRYHDVLYVDWNLQSIDPVGKRTAINLYGPPGTGKSFCAEAIAAEFKRRIIRVNYAEIESKYVGETPKNIQAAFAKAIETDAVVFFDEADSILGRRLTNVTQSADHSVNVSRSVMLLELDRFQGITIFATNLASNFDGAFVRRILGHIELPLPDEECRHRLWMLHLPKEMPIDKFVDTKSLAAASEGLSGGDILNSVIIAASSAVQRQVDRQYVQSEDLLNAIETVRKAKNEVGQHPDEYRSRITTSDIPLSLAPEDVQRRVQNGDSEIIQA